MLFLITSVMAVMYGYIQWFFLSNLALNFWIKVVFSGFIGLGIFNIYVILRFGYLMHDHMIKMFSFAHLLMIYLFFATLLLNVLKLVKVPTSSGVFMLVAVICFISAFAGVHRAGLLPSVKHIEVKNKILPQSWRPMTFIQLSDLHIGQGFDKAWLEGVVEKVNLIEADFVVITGDSIDQSVDVLLPQMAPLSRINKPIYMVFGNHEHYYNANQWEQAFQNMGITVLNNKAKALTYNNNTFILAGADYGAKFTKTDKVVPLFKNLPDNLPRILMAHHPQAFIYAPQNKIALQVSGHTHGGMTFPISLMVKLFNNGYLRGLYRDKNSVLYVSDGTGLWGGMPARLGTSNEITVIKLSR